MFKKQKLNNISNLKVQILDNNHPEYKETVAFYTRDGKNEQRVCFIKRRKGASNSYYIEQTKKRLNELNQKGKLKKKHHFVKPLVIAGSAICAAGLCVGIVFAVKNSTTQKVKVTFDAGIGTFSDGSHVKTITVNKGTNLNQIPHEYASIAYGSDYHIEDDDGFLKFEIIPKTCTIKTWVTDKNKTIDENNGYANYTIDGNVTLFADYSNDLTATKSVAIGEIANAINTGIGFQPEAASKLQTIAEVAYDWLDCASNGYQALAIGEATAKSLISVARQPEAYDYVCNMLIPAYSKISAASTDARSLGLGIAAGKAAESIARQPEAHEKINSAMRIMYENIQESTSAVTGYAIGYTGGYTAVAIAQQNEAVNMIISTYLNAIEHLELADDICETFAICKIGTYTVCSVATQPDSYDLITYLSNTAYLISHNLPNDFRVEAMSETTAEAILGSAISSEPESENFYYTKVIQMVYGAMTKTTLPQQAWALGRAGAGAANGMSYGRGAMGYEMILTELGWNIDRILNINK